RAVHDGGGGGVELGGGGGRGDRGRGWGAGEHVAGGPCGADRPGAGDPGEQAERGQPVWAAGYGLPAEQRAQPRAGGGVHGAGGGFGDAAGPEGAEGGQPGGGGEGGCGQAGQGDAGVEHAGGAEGRAGEGGGAAGDVLDAGDAAACAGVGGPGAHVPGVPVDQCHSDHLPVGVEGGRACWTCMVRAVSAPPPYWPRWSAAAAPAAVDISLIAAASRSARFLAWSMAVAASWWRLTVPASTPRAVICSARCRVASAHPATNAAPPLICSASAPSCAARWESCWVMRW